jgi:hypothetical protein
MDITRRCELAGRLLDGYVHGPGSDRGHGPGAVVISLDGTAICVTGEGNGTATEIATTDISLIPRRQHRWLYGARQA